MSPGNSYVEILAPKVMVLGVGGLWEMIHESGTLMNWSSALLKKEQKQTTTTTKPKSSLRSPPRKDIMEMDGTQKSTLTRT